MFTLVGFSEDCAADDTVQNIASIPDDHVKNEGDAIVIPELNELFGVYACGLLINDVQLISPSLRRVALLDVSPVEIEATPSEPPDPILYPAGQIELDIDEELTCQASIEVVAVTPRATILAFLGDRNIGQVTGKMYTVKAAITGTVVEGQWTSTTMVLSQSLPVGNYAIVGARFESSVAFAFRFVFIGGVWRPGSIAVASRGMKDVPYSRHGALGVWGTFAHNREPIVEVLSSTTAGAGTLYIDVMKV